MGGDPQSRRPISPTDAAARLGVSTRTVQRWLREGRLPGVRVGSRLKVDASAFDVAAAEQPSGISSGRPRAIRRLLVANRGELPVRVARTCRRLGITTIALVASDQVGAWWSTQLDERQPLAGTYLDSDAVINAARAARADAIHPGYGFLAENAEFAEAVTAAGLTWVGPPAAAMRALGDKAAGRRLAARLGVPTLPGYDGTAQDDRTLVRAAAAIGFPVLIKPSAGGGGKGMHVARDGERLQGLLAQARREARSSFGDDRLVLERYLERPHHVEVQLLLDAYGNGVHLGERDCSLQRRHQKVIEEAPSPVVGPALRAGLGEAALRLALAAGYVGAGTAEFLLDERGDFFFLEVNARLQVEHPVTEAVTGRDLVADQLRIAAGEPLGFAQADVGWRGHAMEARLYAEDPLADFVPATGSILDARWPATPSAPGSALRVDRGVGAGDEVGTRYDPLLAKLITHAQDREGAIATLDIALAQTAVLGVTTNRGFLRQLLKMPEVLEGRAPTDFIESSWAPAPSEVDESVWTEAAAVLGRSPHMDPHSNATVRSGFRLNAPTTLRLRIDGIDRAVAVGPRPDSLPWAIDTSGPEPTVVMDVAGRSVSASLAPAPTIAAALVHAHGAEAAAPVVASMPGIVLEVRVHAGEAVEAGQVLFVIEAMKMENAIAAPASGTVNRVNVAEGQQVHRGDLLMELQ
jgi:3-methylcrotonyl-CoA carboxylase alpha subunit